MGLAIMILGLAAFLGGHAFVTFRAERADTPCSYGLVQPLTSHNPVRIAFHDWLAMLRELRAASGLGEAAIILFGPPGTQRTAAPGLPARE